MTGVICILALVALIILRVPVAIAMTVAGLVGLTVLNSWAAAQATLLSAAWTITTSAELIVIPLFVLMGNFVGAGGLSRDLYSAAHAWVGHRRGGLAHATILGCTSFAALCGSSVATALTLGKVALPAMAQRGYGRRLAAGAVAAGGTLGILIPPSTGLVIYAFLADVSIGRLFLAGIIPGLVLAALFMVAISVVCTWWPGIAPRITLQPWAVRLASLGRATPLIAIIVVTLGGIYGGVFTPVEAAAVGAVLAGGCAGLRGSFKRRTLVLVLLRTVGTTAMVYMIIIGASVFTPVLALTGLPTTVATVIGVGITDPLSQLALIVLLFVILGMFLDGLAMLLLALPVALPIIQQPAIAAMLGLPDATTDVTIWFGVVAVLCVEMALISPPVGLNVFVVKGLGRDVPIREIYIGILPFWLAMLVGIALLVLFPQLALFLPSAMLH